MAMTAKLAPAANTEKTVLPLLSPAQRSIQETLIQNLQMALEILPRLRTDPSEEVVHDLRRVLRKINALIQIKGISLEAKFIEKILKADKTLARAVGKIRNWDIARQLWKSSASEEHLALSKKIDDLLLAKRHKAAQKFIRSKLDDRHLPLLQEALDVVTTQPAIMRKVKNDFKASVAKLLHQQKRYAHSGDFSDLHKFRRSARNTRYRLDASGQTQKTEELLKFRKVLSRIQNRVGKIGDVAESIAILKNLQKEPSLCQDSATLKSIKKMRRRLKTELTDRLADWRHGWPKQKEKLKAAC
jgi:CHAD domain-containing protein